LLIHVPVGAASAAGSILVVAADATALLGAQDKYRAHLGHEQLTAFVQVL
jgi:hypothetical protein